MATRGGMVLVVVLVALALLTFAGLTFSELMFAEREATWIHGRSVQARALAESGVEIIKLYAVQPRDTLVGLGGVYDNPLLFQAALVKPDDDPRQQGRVTIVAPLVDAGYFNGVRCGLEDESCRLNLNILLPIDAVLPGGARTLLMALPGMSEDTADAILDWIDSDDDTREFGAEVDVYSGYSPSYAPKNGPLESIEELLLVRGVTPRLLFGPDTNRNGMLDAHEIGAAESVDGVDNTDGALDLGWSAYLTLYSAEANLRPDGTAKIDVNGDDLEALYDELLEALGDQDWAMFICAYRQVGPYEAEEGAQPMAPPQEMGGRSVDLTQEGGTQITSLYELIASQIEVQFTGEPQPTIVASPFSDDLLSMMTYLTTLLDNITVSASASIPGRININQAPRTVLMGIPGLDPEVVDLIISERTADPGDAEPQRQTEAWLLLEGLVTLDEFKALAPLITAGGDVYRAQVVGYYEQAGPSFRAEVVVDATTTTPRILLWRDMSHLGRGYPVELLGAGY